MNAYKSVFGAAFVAAVLLPAAAFATPAAAARFGPAGVLALWSTTILVGGAVIASIDVAKEPAAIPGRLFRMRQLTIKPGGVVPWHSHANRPAIIYVVQGEVTEYASSCSVPLVHKAGDATPELHVTSHWWKNTGKTTAVLISADLLPVDATDPHTM